MEVPSLSLTIAVPLMEFPVIVPVLAQSLVSRLNETLLTPTVPLTTIPLPTATDWGAPPGTLHVIVPPEYDPLNVELL